MVYSEEIGPAARLMCELCRATVRKEYAVSNHPVATSSVLDLVHEKGIFRSFSDDFLLVSYCVFQIRISFPVYLWAFQRYVEDGGQSEGPAEICANSPSSETPTPGTSSVVSANATLIRLLREGSVVDCSAWRYLQSH